MIPAANGHLCAVPGRQKQRDRGICRGLSFPLQGRSRAAVCAAPGRKTAGEVIFCAGSSRFFAGAVIYC